MLWKILGSVVAFVGLYFVRRYFGTVASVIVAAGLLFGWWLLHLYTDKRLDALYCRLQQLDAEQRAQVLQELDPEIRKDFEKRSVNEGNG